MPWVSSGVMRLIKLPRVGDSWQHPDLYWKCKNGKDPGELSTEPCPCSSTTSQDLCNLLLSSCPRSRLQTKSQPPLRLPFPGCMRNNRSQPRTVLHPNRAVMVTTNAQQTPALRNRNLTGSARPCGATRQPWLGAPRSPRSPHVPPLGFLGSAAPGAGWSSGRRAADVPSSRSAPACCQLSASGLLHCLLLPSPARAAAGWMFQLPLPGLVSGAVGWK